MRQVLINDAYLRPAACDWTYAVVGGVGELRRSLERDAAMAKTVRRRRRGSMGWR